MKICKSWVTGASVLLTVAAAAGCSKQEEPAKARVAPPAASSAKVAAPSASSFAVADEGSASFLIDAPLEKIKGKATRFRGSLSVNPEQLEKSRGQIDVDLTTLETHTFDDAEKNTKQTEHSHNWLELGSDVEAKQRTENQWVRFTIQSVKATPEALSQAPEAEGRRRAEISAEGDLWLHGVSSHKTVKLAVSFKGSPDAPSELQITTLEPLTFSLKEHDVKPRDVTGKFLQGALEKVGDKIVDQVQVSLDFTATASPKK